MNFISPYKSSDVLTIDVMLPDKGYAIPFVLPGLYIITQIVMEYQSGNVRAAFYSDANGPSTLLYDAGVQPSSLPTALWDFSGTPLTLPTGKYWLVLICDSIIPARSFKSTDALAFSRNPNISSATDVSKILGVIYNITYATAFPSLFNLTATGIIKQLPMALLTVSARTNNLPSGQLAATIADITVPANANTIVVGGFTIAPIPAFAIIPKDSFRFTVDGEFTGTVTATTVQVRLGTTGTTSDPVILSASFLGAVGTSQCKLVGEFTFRSVGVAGSVAGALLLVQASALGLANAAIKAIPFTSPNDPNTTTDSYLTVSLLTSAAGSSGSTTVGIIEKL